MNPRILLFVFDATGLGHLRRVSRIANELTKTNNVLLVTGMREATWFLNDRVEVVILPNMMKLPGAKKYDPLKSSWPNVEANAVLSSRRTLLNTIAELWRPDALLVDYLPYGRRGELTELLQQLTCKKYFLLRGIIDQADFTILSAQHLASIAEIYDKILIACDPAFFDATKKYGLDEGTGKKVTYTGFVGPKSICPSEIRALHDIPENRGWVVCSAGGGVRAEQFLEACVKAAQCTPDLHFTVISGPFANCNFKNGYSAPNCEIIIGDRDFSDILGGADVAVLAGGYNSMLEAATSGARIIVYPTNSKIGDEQLENAILFGKHYPVRLLSSISELSIEIANEYANCLQGRPRLLLDTDGAGFVKSLLQKELQYR